MADSDVSHCPSKQLRRTLLLDAVRIHPPRSVVSHRVVHPRSVVHHFGVDLLLLASGRRTFVPAYLLTSYSPLLETVARLLKSRLDVGVHGTQCRTSSSQDDDCNIVPCHYPRLEPPIVLDHDVEPLLPRPTRLGPLVSVEQSASDSALRHTRHGLFSSLSESQKSRSEARGSGLCIGPVSLARRHGHPVS